MRLRREKRWIAPIALLMVVGLLSGGYVLNKQRLQSPLAERYTLKMEFAAVDAVTPGLGAPVTVAGVGVGQIDGVELKEGRGIVSVSMDPAKLRHVYPDATAALVPNTPLKDMQVRLWPGTKTGRPLEDGSTIAIRATTTPVDANELLRMMDADTRDWVTMLITDLGVGTKRRGRDLNAVLRKLGPTAAQLRSITSLMADRRVQIRRLVHNLSVVTKATADVDSDIREVVSAGDATLAVLAANELPLRRTLDRLPAGARRRPDHARPDAAVRRVPRADAHRARPDGPRRSPDAPRDPGRATRRRAAADGRARPVHRRDGSPATAGPPRVARRGRLHPAAAPLVRRARPDDGPHRACPRGRPVLPLLAGLVRPQRQLDVREPGRARRGGPWLRPDLVRLRVLPGELNPLLEQLLGPGSPTCQEDAP